MFRQGHPVSAETRRGTSGILIMRAGLPVGAEAPRILFLITPQNRAGGRRDDDG